MHSKRNNKETKTFLQGLRPFGKSLPKSVKNIFKKNGNNYSEIISKWNVLMRAEIANVCYPKSIKLNSGNVNATLIVAVKRGNEILVEYSKKEIVSKINTYVGYNFIRDIRLENVNAEIKIKRNFNNFNIQSTKLEKKIMQIKNANIKKAFIELVNEIKKI